MFKFYFALCLLPYVAAFQRNNGTIMCHVAINKQETSSPFDSGYPGSAFGIATGCGSCSKVIYAYSQRVLSAIRY